MNDEIFRFFEGHMPVLPLYERLEQQLQQMVEPLELRVKKSQISFFSRRMFGCVSFLRVRPKKELPENYLVVTIGLDHPVYVPRIAVTTEPYPGRWTHHVVLAREVEIDEELLGWLQEAAAFAQMK